MRYEGAADERNDEPPEARDMVEDVCEVCEDATELRPVSCQLPHAHVGPALRTAVHSLLEHALDHVRTMAREQRLDVPHRLVRYLHILVHDGGC